MWDLPRSGIKSILPALADGLFTTDPPGKTSNSLGGGFHDFPMLFLPSFKPGTFCMLGEHDGGFLVAQMVKSLPAMQETQVWSLGQEDPLEKGMATHSSILVWRIPWTKAGYSP